MTESVRLLTFVEQKINDAVLEYIKKPSSRRFDEIVKYTDKSLLRGAVNVDQFGHNTMVHSVPCHIAMVAAGYKPLCTVSFHDIYDWMSKYDLKFILVKRQAVVWLNDDQYDNAKELAKYMKTNSLCGGAHTKEHYYIVGKYLGYPVEDTTYFIEHLKQQRIHELQLLS